MPIRNCSLKDSKVNTLLPSGLHTGDELSNMQGLHFTVAKEKPLSS